MEERSLKKTIREELAKLKRMTWRGRLGYVWDYYKPLMLAIVGVIFIVYLGSSIYHNLQIQELISVYMVNCSDVLVDSGTLVEEYTEYLGGIGSKEAITIDTSLMLDPSDDSQAGMAYQMKFTAITSSRMADVLLMDEEHFTEYLASGYFEDLRLVLSDEQLEQWDAIFFYAEDENGELVPYGIDLSSSELIQEYDLYPEGGYAGVLVDAKNAGMCESFFAWLYS